MKKNLEDSVRRPVHGIAYPFCPVKTESNDNYGNGKGNEEKEEEEEEEDSEENKLGVERSMENLCYIDENDKIDAEKWEKKTFDVRDFVNNLDLLTFDNYGDDDWNDLKGKFNENKEKNGQKNGGGVVDFFNCLSIFMEYCQTVMKQNFSTANLYEIDEIIISEIPEIVKKYLFTVIFPTPEGIMAVTNDEIDAFWGEIEFKDLIQPELLKKYNALEIAKRRAVYVVVLKLHELNLLDSTNEATVRAKIECKKNCPPFLAENKITLTHRYLNYEHK